MRKRLALTLATAVVGSLALVAPPAQANHSWGTYHWARTTTTFTLSVGDNVDNAWQSYFDASNVDWTLSSVLDLAPVAGGTTGRRCRATAGRIEVCNAAYGRNGWLGLASISISGGTHITQGTAKMNDTYFAMNQYNNPDEKLHVMCQEVGHTFGLGHTSEDGTSQKTCMDYSTSPDSTRPNQHDFDQLASIYTHLDTSTTIGATAGRTAASVGDERSTWGTEVARGVHGEFSIFERDFGNGEKVITHVTWALDAPAGRSGA